MTEFTPTIEQIEPATVIAARWWADRLRESAGVVAELPMFDQAGLMRDTEDGLKRAVFVDIFSQMARDKSSVTASHCDDFQKRLHERIRHELYHDSRHCWRDVGGWDDGGPDLHLSVDYSPDEILLNMLRDAGVDRNMAEMFGLPHKTDMRVSARRVEVSHGYGASWRYIYGPAWGCTRAEQSANDEARYVAREEYSKWLGTLSCEERNEVDPIFSDRRPKWQGPVRW